jgi:hypothetical protein
VITILPLHKVKRAFGTQEDLTATKTPKIKIGCSDLWLSKPKHHLFGHHLQPPPPTTTATTTATTGSRTPSCLFPFFMSSSSTNSGGGSGSGSSSGSGIGTSSGSHSKRRSSSKRSSSYRVSTSSSSTSTEKSKTKSHTDKRSGNPQPSGLVTTRSTRASSAAHHWSEETLRCQHYAQLPAWTLSSLKECAGDVNDEYASSSSSVLTSSSTAGASSASGESLAPLRAQVPPIGRIRVLVNLEPKSPAEVGVTSSQPQTGRALARALSVSTFPLIGRCFSCVYECACVCVLVYLGYH